MGWQRRVKKISDSNWTLLATIITILTLFNLAQLWFNGWFYMLDIALVLLVMLICIKHWRVSLAELGLLPKNLKSGLIWGLLICATAILLLGVVYILRPVTFLDSRYHSGWLHALKTALIIIPFRVIFFEEFMFRGMLLLSLRRLIHLRLAALACSLMFGLWHIVPSLNLASSSQTLHQIGGSTNHPTLLAITLAVLATTIAGVFLCWLRIRSRSLLAPILTHWSVNAVSVMLVAAAYLKFAS